MVQVAPSMLSADFLHLEKDVKMVNANADIFHLDVMDGVFVPNISYGFPVIDAISSIAERPLDAHLMIVSPEKYVERCAKSGVGMLSFHLNATENPGAVLDLVHSSGIKAGIAINPDIPVERLYPFLKGCDFVLIMSVFAGFGGQKFIEDTYGRVSAVRAEIERQGCNCLIEVDGGVSPANSALLAAAGADILVAGSSVFKAEDPAAAIAAMRQPAENTPAARYII
ncbi:MAG: ribulose-phosphate 3-epimerase [Bacteroidales bacterium]|nr:ribulose-phosphate 3-epimerase [Bacteroidales bacterium]